MCKDFTSVLSMNRDARSAVFAALREIFDGSWTRRVGVDGGRSLAWSGKVGLLSGCTPMIDSHHAVIAAMGERFLSYRIPRPAERDHAEAALRQLGREPEMRRSLSSVCGRPARVATSSSRCIGSLQGERRERLIDLATLVARCRSAVERDSYSREITLIPDAEAPTRLSLGLARLFGGLVSIGVPEPDAWRIIVKTGADSMPAIRKAVLDLLLKKTEPADTSVIATELDYPTVTTRRALEDLTAHGVVKRTHGGKGKADVWEITPRTSELIAGAGISELP